MQSAARVLTGYYLRVLKVQQILPASMQVTLPSKTKKPLNARYEVESAASHAV
jgi:hypothetical protein